MPYGYNLGYGSGNTPIADPPFLPFARLATEELDFLSLPEEVREALNEHEDELHSAEDLRAMVDRLSLRR